LTVNAAEAAERTHEPQSAICFTLSLEFSTNRDVSSNSLAKFGRGA
jgi:hypothetical protein